LSKMVTDSFVILLMYRYKREKRIDFVMKQDDMHKR